MDFLQLAKERYACRTYTDRKIEPEIMARILEAGRVAPTAVNFQPQRVIVVNTPEGMERLTRCTRDFKAPAALVVCADTREAWTRKYDQMNHGVIDATIVTDHMMMQAQSEGVNSLWVCCFKPEIVRAEFNIPEGIEPINILFLGYSSEAPLSPDRHAELRKPLSETVVYNKF